MNDYKPGTVAAATVRGIRAVHVMAGYGTAEPRLRWLTTDPRLVDEHNDGWYFSYDVTDVRPLALVDPEDRDQVGRLLSKLRDMSFAAHACGAFTCLQVGLRELLKPPRIPEPALFGIVEGWQHGEDRENSLSAFYLREATTGEEDWTRTSDGKKFEWDDIAMPILVRKGVEQA